MGAVINDFEINESDLDGEWLRQPVLYEKWARLASSAQKDQSKIDLKRKILKAKLYKEAKSRLEKEGKKPTGADLEAEIRTNTEYEKISIELIDAEEKVALMDAGKWSMVEKSKALDRLCVDRDKGFFMPSSVESRSTSDRMADKTFRDALAAKRSRR